jgi:hypothetical protein
VAIDLLASRRANGLLTYSTKHYRLRIRALSEGAMVQETVFTEHDFAMTVGANQSFDRLELLLEPLQAVQVDVAGPAPCLRKFCYTSLGLIQQQQDVELIREHWARVFDAITITDGDDPDEVADGLIHEPESSYRVEIDVKTESADSIDGPWTDRGTRTEQLSVPVGYAPQDLSPYLESIVPDDGQRPVYADYDLRVTYNRAYVEAMYRKSGDPLRAFLFDGMGRPVEPTAVPARTDHPGLTPELELFLERVADAGCVSVDVTTIVGNDETTYTTRLATSTPYEVRIRGGGHSDPLYRWTFTTGRYRNFVEHVNHLREQAWNERLPEAVDWTALEARLAAVATADRDEEFDLFLMAWQQDMGLNLRTLPDRPEVTLFWELPDGLPAARAIAIVSPEPLMTDRTELRLLRMDSGGGAGEQPFRRLRSRDGTRTLIVPVDTMGNTIPLGPADYLLDFVYRLSGPGLVKLTRGGSSADETAVWPFTVSGEPEPLVDPEA